MYESNYGWWRRPRATAGSTAALRQAIGPHFTALVRLAPKQLPGPGVREAAGVETPVIVRTRPTASGPGRRSASPRTSSRASWQALFESIVYGTPARRRHEEYKGCRSGRGVTCGPLLTQPAFVPVPEAEPGFRPPGDSAGASASVGRPSSPPKYSTPVGPRPPRARDTRTRPGGSR